MVRRSKVRAWEPCAGEPQSWSCISFTSTTSGRLPASISARRAAIAKKCGAKLTLADLTGGSGLGFERVADECGPPIGDVAALTACIATQHRCVGAQLLDAETARARELMTVAGVPAASLQTLPCLPDHGGAGTGLNDAKGLGKAVTKCVASAQKAGAAFVKAKVASLGKCVTAAFACQQQHPANDACRTKATATCDHAFKKIADAAAKLPRAVEKGCAAIPYATLRTADAANLDALAGACAAHGVAPLDGLAAYETCLLRTHACRGEDLVRVHAPRAEEMLHAVGRELQSATCPGQCSP